METTHPDPAAARTFYEGLFGWTFVSGARIPDAGESYVAQLRDRDVAGLGPFLDGDRLNQPAWISHVRVDRVGDAARAAIAAQGTLLLGPLYIPGAGRMAVLSDPAGAIFAIWEATARQGAERVNEAGAWSLTTLNSPDPVTSERFYGAVFGWKSQAFGETGFRAFRLTGYVGGVPYQPVPRDVVSAMQPLASDDLPHWEVDFWVDDVDAAAARATELGGTVVQVPRDTGVFRYAVLADPQGAMFTISKMTTKPGGEG